MIAPSQLSSFDVHNKLSPLLTRLEVLIACCCDAEGASADDQQRASVLHSLLEEQAAKLRDGLDSLCGQEKGDAPCQPCG